MSELDQLIAAAKSSFVAIDTAYQQADINEKLVMAETRNKAADQLVTLQQKKLIVDASAVTPADVSEMQSLKQRVDNAADLQSALLTFVGLAAKFVG